MSGLATDLWEFRATAGSANAGGGFDSASGGTDYSNQDAAQLQLTDLATGGIGSTALSSVVGGFTAAMIGNYIQIRSGTNVVAGFYRMTARTDTNNVTIDRAADDGAGGIASASGDLGGALDILTDDFFDAANAVIVPGSTIYIKNDGTMTLTGGILTLLDGTNLLPITIEGYDTTRGDAPTLTNMPLIAAGANTFSFDDFWIFKHLRLTTTNSGGFTADNGTLVENCQSFNSSGSANRDAFGFSTSSCLVRCDGRSTLGEAFQSGLQVSHQACYIHDSAVGINLGTTNGNVVAGCVFDTCGTGVRATNSSNGHDLLGNVFYLCSKAVETTGTGNFGWMVTNNVFLTNTTGVDLFEADRTMFVDHNCWHDNGTDTVNVSKGPNAVNADPLLNDPANGDFTLQSGSPTIDAGLKLTTAVGVVGVYKQNIGVDQDDNAAGGAASILGGGQLTGGFS